MRITFVALCFSVLFFSCSTPKTPTADLILTNGRIWTGEDSASFVEAIAIRGNKIMKTGDVASITKLQGDSTTTIDLKGKLVTAGFNDAHIHFLSGSLSLLEANHLEAKSVEEVIDIVVKFAAAHPEKEWITGRGWQYSFFSSGLPDHQSLAKLNELNRPVFIRAYDGHSAWANKVALARAGISRASTFEGFGEIVKDKRGEPTGAFKERAAGLVSKLIPDPSYAEKLTALRLGMKMAASLGITSLQNANGSEVEIQLFKELIKNNELSLRYAASFSVDESTGDEAISRFTFLKDSIGLTNPFLRADAIKFVMDGVIESHTASMLLPYSDLAPTSPDALGKLNMSPANYQQWVTKLDAKGFRLYTHAIGDRGVRLALDAYENAATINGTKDKRHRIEHIETIHPDDILRFAKLGVMASMEPIHADPGTIAVWEQAIGPDRLPNSFAWKSMLKNNAVLVFSSDWPAAISVNPIRGIHVAVNRKTPEGLPEAGWVVQEKIRMDQAMKAYTSAGAYSSFEEDRKGKIAPGYLADIIVHSQNLFTIDPTQTHQSKILMTVFDGKIIYDQMTDQ
jgi:Predicted metal-dependent hydrolase with the TIM-barrel fold